MSFMALEKYYQMSLKKDCFNLYSICIPCTSVPVSQKTCQSAFKNQYPLFFQVQLVWHEASWLLLY